MEKIPSLQLTMNIYFGAYTFPGKTIWGIR